MMKHMHTFGHGASGRGLMLGLLETAHPFVIVYVFEHSTY